MPHNWRNSRPQAWARHAAEFTWETMLGDYEKLLLVAWA